MIQFILGIVIGVAISNVEKTKEIFEKIVNYIKELIAKFKKEE